MKLSYNKFRSFFCLRGESSCLRHVASPGRSSVSKSRMKRKSSKKGFEKNPFTHG